MGGRTQLQSGLCRRINQPVPTTDLGGIQLRELNRGRTRFFAFVLIIARFRPATVELRRPPRLSLQTSFTAKAVAAVRSS